MKINPLDFKDVKVMIVDDDTFLLEMYSNKFKKYGFQTNIALNGVDALAKLEDGVYKPDIILSDVIMPHMNGVDFLKNLREKKIAENAIIVMLTNQGMADDLNAVKPYHVDGYIIKALAIPTEVVEQVVEIYYRLRPGAPRTEPTVTVSSSSTPPSPSAPMGSFK